MSEPHRVPHLVAYQLRDDVTVFDPHAHGLFGNRSIKPPLKATSAWRHRPAGRSVCQRTVIQPATPARVSVARATDAWNFPAVHVGTDSRIARSVDSSVAPSTGPVHWRADCAEPSSRTSRTRTATATNDMAGFFAICYRSSTDAAPGAAITLPAAPRRLATYRRLGGFVGGYPDPRSSSICATKLPLHCVSLLLGGLI